MKRSVVVMCHGVTPHARAGLFSAANLLQGRVDVWCRCVTAGLYLSDDVRLVSQEVLSELSDVDFAEAVSRLSLQTFLLEAAQQSYTTISRLSLFNQL